MRHELDEAGIILEQEQASRLAFGSLLGILNTEGGEHAAIFSAAADALEAYSAEAALEAAKDPNFDPAGFVASGDTAYIHAPRTRPRPRQWCAGCWRRSAARPISRTAAVR